MRKKLLTGEGGFTLPEMMVTLMVMIVVLFSLYNIFDMSLRVFSFGNDKVEAVENARLGLEKMEREIRAAYPYDKGAATPDTHLFDTWTPTAIKFGNDLDGNRKIECPASGTPPCETIAYDIYQPVGSTTYALARVNSNAGTRQPVVEYVDYVSASDTGLSFSYFEKDGITEVLPGGDETKIAMVRVGFRIRVENEPQDGTQILTTDVSLRNRSR